MAPQHLEQIIRQGEGLTIEFKQARKGLPADLFESVCAFLNKQGGHVLLGVQNGGTVTGVAPELVDQLKKEFTTLSNNPTKLNPPFLLNFTSVTVAGQEVLYVYVPQSSQVHRCGGVIFDRGHEGDFRVTDNDRISQVYARKSTFYTENRIFPYLTPEDFKPGILEKARQLIRSRSPLHPWLALADQEMLRTAGLYRRDHQTGQEGYTLAAALMFGSDIAIQSVLPHYRIDALVRIADLNRYDDRLDIRTNLIDAYDLLMQFVDKHLPDKFYLQGDQRINLREKIFREIVANLIVHREYTHGAPARLIIYADRVETDNANKPHGFGPINPNGFSPFPKNPDIAKFFLQMGRVDELGSGVRNVIAFTPKYAPGRQAEFLEEDMFKAIIPIPVSNKSQQGDGVNDGIGGINGGVEGANDGVKAGNGGVFDGVNQNDITVHVNEGAVEGAIEGAIEGTVEGIVEGTKAKLKTLLMAIAKEEGRRIPVYKERTGFTDKSLERYLSILRNSELIEFRGESNQTGGYYLTEKIKAKISK